MLLKMESVSSFYGQVLALRDISIQVEEGELVTLIGANGAGKSTTLKIISGVIRPRTGNVELAGEDISQTSPREIIKRGVVHVPEGRQIFPYMTVLENLEMGAFMVSEKRIMKDRLEEVFKLFPVLKNRFNQEGGTLSGGEQQMLAIGRGLMSRPRLLLLDEPSLGLAPIIVREVMKIIKSLKEMGITILLVEQNASLALKISTKGYVLETGKIALSGRSEILLNDIKVKNAYLGV